MKLCDIRYYLIIGLTCGAACGAHAIEIADTVYDAAIRAHVPIEYRADVTAAYKMAQPDVTVAEMANIADAGFKTSSTRLTDAVGFLDTVMLGQIDYLRAPVPTITDLDSQKDTFLEQISDEFTSDDSEDTPVDVAVEPALSAEEIKRITELREYNAANPLTPIDTTTPTVLLDPVDVAPIEITAPEVSKKEQRQREHDLKKAEREYARAEKKFEKVKLKYDQTELVVLDPITAPATTGVAGIEIKIPEVSAAEAQQREMMVLSAALTERALIDIEYNNTEPLEQIDTTPPAVTLDMPEIAPIKITAPEVSKKEQRQRERDLNKAERAAEKAAKAEQKRVKQLQSEWVAEQIEYNATHPAVTVPDDLPVLDIGGLATTTNHH